MSMAGPEFHDVVGMAQAILDELNQQYGTNVMMKVVSVSDLHNWGLNPRYAGFVIQESPAVIYIVPQNIQIPEEAVKTVRHEFKHVLDLTGACPFCTAPMRELRALEFERSPVAGRPSPQSIQINEVIDSLIHVDPQRSRFPADLTVPEECQEFVGFIGNSMDLLVENSRLLGRLELLDKEARKRGPEAMRKLQEAVTSTKLDIEKESNAIFREAVRLSECLVRLEVERAEERLREIMRPLGRVSGRAAAINEAIEEIDGHTFGAPVRICGPKGCVDVKLALIDTGSTFSLIPIEIAEEVGFQEKGKKRTRLADERFMTSPIGTLEFTILGQTMDVPVIVMGKEVAIGASTLEILGFAVDPMREKIFPTDQIEPHQGEAITFPDWLRNVRRATEGRESPYRVISHATGPIRRATVITRVTAINEAIEETIVVDDVRYKLKLQAVIGELVAAQSHLAHLDPDISAKIRAIKKRLQIAIWGRSA